MDKIPHTTVVLTENAQNLKEDLAPIFGLKNILSAGLILFGKLSDTEQKKIITDANAVVISVEKPKNIRDALKNLKQLTTGDDDDFKVKIRLLSKDEQALVSQIRSALGPGPPLKKEKSKKA